MSWQDVTDELAVAIVPVTAFAQNATVLLDRTTGRGALVDPGGEGARLLAVAAERDVVLEKILLTHGHVDHAGATESLRRELDVPVIGPQEEDAFWLDSLPHQAAAFGLGSDALACRPDTWLEHEDRVEVGSLAFEVLHLPGHTPGHVAFFQREAQLVLVGDVLFRGSIGRTDFPKGDHATLLRSIRERLLPLGDEVTFLPGHGPTSTLGRERRENPFLVGAGDDVVF